MVVLEGRRVADKYPVALRYRIIRYRFCPADIAVEGVIKSEAAGGKELFGREPIEFIGDDGRTVVHPPDGVLEGHPLPRCGLLGRFPPPGKFVARAGVKLDLIGGLDALEGIPRLVGGEQIPVVGCQGVELRYRRIGERAVGNEVKEPRPVT